MAMVMHKLGVPAVSLNAFQVTMHTTSSHQNARLKRIDTERIRRELDAHRIVIVTGFQGVDKYDDYTTLGRGGSDTTAVALAAALMQMPARFIQMWTAFTQPTHVRFQMQES